MTAVTEQFTSSLTDLDVDSTVTTADHLGEVLADLVEAPAVGAPLGYPDLSLAELAPTVETDPSVEALRTATTGVTRGALGVASYGSVVIRIDDEPTTEHASLFVETHVVVLSASDIQPDMTDAIDTLGPLLREEAASAIVATGPSATADMGALVKGAHGPKEIHVVVLEDR